MSVGWRSKAWFWFHPAIRRVLHNEDRWHVEHTDALNALRALPDDCIDSCVTDPPSGIAFMGKDWDHDKGGRDAWIAWLASIMTEVARVLKPGAHAFVWSLPRTSHWTGMALENAGFEVRDSFHHVFATGFPKSKKLGEGVGTAAKPAHEVWWLVRKPFTGTLEQNYAAHGTGGLNIDACRVAHASAADLQAHADQVTTLKAKGGSLGNSWKNSSDLSGANDVSDAGRWPPNLVFSHHPECRCIGTVELDANPSWDTPNRATEPSKFTGSEVSKVRHATRAGEPSAERRYTDQGVTGFAALPGERRDDTEDIERWECVEGCAVAELNSQSEAPHIARFFPCLIMPAWDIQQAETIGHTEPLASAMDAGIDAGADLVHDMSLSSSKTGGSGKMSTASMFPPDMKSTIKTKTPETTLQAISKPLADKTITDTMIQNERRTVNETDLPSESVHDVKNGSASSTLAHEQPEPITDTANPASFHTPGNGVIGIASTLKNSEESSTGTSVNRRGYANTSTFAVPTNPISNAAPFVYVAKPSTSERDQGLEAFRVLSGGDATGRKDGSAGTQNPRAGAGRTGGRRNHHATVKSVDLIRWLTKLITPPGGLVVDPFAGSGTGGIAALRDGYRWLGFELNDDDEEPSVSVARARISWCEGREYIPRPSLRAKDSPAKLSLLGLFNKNLT